MPAKTLVAMCVGIVTACLSGPAWGAPMACSPRAAVLDQLSTRFHEAPVAVGLTNNGALLELLTSPEGETWTIIITMPNGATCLMAAGEDWQQLAAPEPGEPS